MAVKSNHTYH